MRKHVVECVIENNTQDVTKELQGIVNFYYASNIKNIVDKTALSKEEKIELINRLQKILKKNIKQT